MPDTSIIGTHYGKTSIRFIHYINDTGVPVMGVHIEDDKREFEAWVFIAPNKDLSISVSLVDMVGHIISPPEPMSDLPSFVRLLNVEAERILDMYGEQKMRTIESPERSREIGR